MEGCARSGAVAVANPRVQRCAAQPFGAGPAPTPQILAVAGVSRTSGVQRTRDALGNDGMRTTQTSIPEMRLDYDAPRDHGETPEATDGDRHTADDDTTPAALPAAPVRSAARVLVHWLIVLGVAMAATLALIRDQLADKTARAWLLEGHRHFGLLVLVLCIVGFVLRIRSRRLPSASHSPAVIRAAATVTHFALYALLGIQPMLGWALSDAQGKPVHVLGATLPALVAPDFDLADNLQAWHQNVAWVLLALVSLHVGAACWHHFVVRDDVLRAMLPRRRRR